jgi:probable DNA repair protein
MLINANLDSINAESIIVLANNRQVIAFKNTWKKQKKGSRLPKIFSWKKYLVDCWEMEKSESTSRFISEIESRHLIEKSISKFGQYADSRLVEEVIKNNNYCCDYLISLSKLSNSKITESELFCKWIHQYKNTKAKLDLIDVNDLPSLLINSTNNHSSVYIYGFKSLTPIQISLFSKVGYKSIKAIEYESDVSSSAFDTTVNEINSAITWANKLYKHDPSKSIVIVSPNLSEMQHQLRSSLDQELDDLLVENNKKKYNISLGLPLIQYPLIQSIISILDLSYQLQVNNISSSTFIHVVSSVYISNYQNELSARALLVNKILSMSKDTFSFEEVNGFLSRCPEIENITDEIIKISSTNNNKLDYYLEQFDHILKVWGFTSNRAISSIEYQLFKKYLLTSIELNKLSHIYNKTSYANALKELKKILSQVIFQPQGGQNQIQILGYLEAESIHFDYAWVIGMTSNFLPAKINNTRFIPFNISSDYQIPHSSYELINKDSINTLSGLRGLAKEVVFSYAKMHLEEEQLPTPFVYFNIDNTGVKKNTIIKKDIQYIDDSITSKISSKHIKSGVSTLKDQMACSFKGFVHRLNIETLEKSHIGLDRREQGKIIHEALQLIYEEIKSKEVLINLSGKELDKIIESKINTALEKEAQSEFKKIEKIRISQLINKFIEQDKLRDDFKVVSTEQTIKADISGLNFNIRLDRLDQMSNNDRIVFDYKTGNTSINSWCSEVISEPQLPIYAVTNQTDGAAFIELKSNKIAFKGISKNNNSLPKQSSNRLKCEDWDKQLEIWKHTLESASKKFQNGVADVLPIKGSCQYCENHLLCRVEK